MRVTKDTVKTLRVASYTTARTTLSESFWDFENSIAVSWTSMQQTLKWMKVLNRLKIGSKFHSGHRLNCRWKLRSVASHMVFQRSSYTVYDQRAVGASITLMYKLCVMIWKTGEWPIDCCRTPFVQIPKKGVCESARITERYLWYVMQVKWCWRFHRIERSKRWEIFIMQVGYTNKRVTRDHIFNLNSPIRKWHEMQNLFACFVDFSTPFDNVTVGTRRCERWCSAWVFRSK